MNRISQIFDSMRVIRLRFKRNFPFFSCKTNHNYYVDSQRWGRYEVYPCHFKFEEEEEGFVPIPSEPIIYLEDKEGNKIPFPKYTKHLSKYVSSYLNFYPENGTFEKPIPTNVEGIFLSEISKMIIQYPPEAEFKENTDRVKEAIIEVTGPYSNEMLYSLINVADYLLIKSLVDALSSIAADRLSPKPAYKKPELWHEKPPSWCPIM